MARPNPYGFNDEQLTRRGFIDRAGRYALGGVAAGSALKLAGTAAAAPRAWYQVPSKQPPDIAPPVITRLRDNLYFIGGADAEQKQEWTGGSNLVFITQKNGVVLVDTKNPGWGEHMQKLVRSVTDKPITTIVITHTHYDHTGSNIEFPSTINFVAHANCVRSMSQKECNFTTGCSYFQGENAKYLPKTTFRDRLTLFSGPDTVELYYYGPAHTDGDTIVYIPSLNAMHPGDVYPGRYSPFIDTINGGSGLGYDNVLRKMVQNFKKVDYMLPAHRDHIEPWSRVVEYSGWWSDFVGDIERGMKAGKTAKQIADEYKLPVNHPGFKLNTMGAPTRLHINVGVIYEELKKA
jgi:cyclase